MFTQCPDCEIAFKVTAVVLKQAAGKVRCGGCGNAFNALDYLSEQMPKQPVSKEANAALPELKPEIIETDNGLPPSISAEQSAALLKTLDELAGSDIRIEDTGVEWRVLDEEEAAEPAADDDDAGPNEGGPIKNVDEFLDDAETPIDEFLTATPEVVDSPEIFAGASSEPARMAVDELRFDDNTPLPDDFDLDEESSVAQDQPAEVEEEVVEDVDDEPAPEIALSEPEEWTDILGEFQELAAEISAPVETTAADIDDSDDEQPPEDPADEPDIDHPLDMDTQFALQAEAMGIELSGIDDLDAELEDDADSEEEFDDEPDLEDATAEVDLIDDDNEEQELIDEPIVASHTIENELAGLGDDSGDSDEPDESGEHYVPPMTEEEHTVNMQIDEDLMALAIEDEDGYASTIVIPHENAEDKAIEQKAEETDSDEDEDDLEFREKPGFETIVMEGEFVRSAMDTKKLAADKAAAAELAAQAHAREAEQSDQSGGIRHGMIAGVVLLVLLLAGQLMHQSREALATNPAFSNTVGQVYRAIGQPVQPAWDITGWRFEATKGNADGEDGELNVYSRLGNNSDGPLPYPLIGISLTDRFEETLGSRVLDPAEYLPNDLDPRKLVEPGNTFNAVITIKSTSEDATGFKLNVCYRLSDGQLRCAIDDFL